MATKQVWTWNKRNGVVLKMDADEAHRLEQQGRVKCYADDPRIERDNPTPKSKKTKRAKKPANVEATTETK